MSNYPSGMSAKDWKHIENPETTEPDEEDGMPPDADMMIPQEEN